MLCERTNWLAKIFLLNCQIFWGEKKKLPLCHEDVCFQDPSEFHCVVEVNIFPPPGLQRDTCKEHEWYLFLCYKVSKPKICVRH